LIPRVSNQLWTAVGAGQHYGLSVRGLAVDTGLHKPEEFPWFREFWIEKPTRDSRSLSLYALLDSESVTGAYRFEVVPGSETLIDVEAELFFRKSVERLGVAPITSMYLHGAQSDRLFDDFRPEVHDSDGLAISRGTGEWLWRPLGNSDRLRMSIYREDSPRGFGLLQRERGFERFQDLEAEYQRRPSVWVEPLGGWGLGGVHLVEIPSDSEKYDNIVSFWVPEVKPETGSTARFAYRLYFTLERPAVPPMGKTASTWVGAGGLEDLDSSRRRFVIEFNGRELSRIPPEQPPKAVVTASAGEVVNQVVQWNRYSSNWRVAFELLPGDAELVELRAVLQGEEERPLTETWSYQWTTSVAQ
jgi:glucans biosynthesis protein